jgi:putative nucleotidyltransferase with HDIG domain
MAKLNKKTRQSIAVFLLESAVLAFAVFLSLFIFKTMLEIIIMIFLLSSIVTYYIFSIKKLSIETELLNLGNLGNPLLSKLLKVAPGTYNHSLIVAQLASSSGKVISLSSDFLRLGGYYHDIGKIKNPYEFIENGRKIENSHLQEKRIINHVKNGLKIAREYSLPKEICDLIREHHGDGKIESFKDSAFNYPGPKPQSKVSGIIMLSDCVEASIRSQKNLSDQMIEKIVQTEVDKKLKSGQLDEAGLAGSDIVKIKQDFISTLINIYHKRKR